MSVPSDAVPMIPRGVRLHRDHIRDRWVLLAPERTIALDPVSHAIIQAIDGQASVATIVQNLAAIYQAPETQIRGDVIDYITGLCDRRILEVRS